MSRILVFFGALILVASCGKKGDKTEQAVPSGKQTAQGQPQAMIPDEDELSEFERIADARITPYFDSGASQQTKSVAPGEYFDIYVFGEYSELYPMSAAEYKLQLPGGVMVMGELKSDSTILSLGRYDNDFLIAFHCLPGPKALLVKYSCKADENFEGGIVETQKGADLNFLGFTMCDETKTLIRGKGGKAELTKK